MNENQQQKILHYLYRMKSYGYKYHDIVHMNLNDADMEVNKDIVDNCMLCDANKYAKNKNFDYGDQNSQLLVLSTLYIEDENEIELLQNMIEKVLFLKFESIYRLNIVKCHIKKNHLHNDFINQCSPYVLKQLNNLQRCKVILAFGESYKHIISQDIDLDSLMFKLIDYGKKKVLILPDLDYILKNPSVKKNILESLHRVKVYLES